MLKISVQEAFAFDSLSILLIKIIRNQNDSNLQNYSSLLSELYLELGYDKVNNVINSQEYRNLFEINQKIFYLVDMVKLNPCLGKEIDTENFNRFRQKQELQSKFFNSAFREQKFGYTEL